MITSDIVFLIAMVVSIALGALLGFGKMFRIMIKGVIGFIFATYLAYLLANLMYNLPFIQDFSHLINDGLANAGNPFCDFLINLRLDFVIIVIILILILQVLRLLIGKSVQDIMEINNPVMKVINHVGGALFTGFMAFTLMLFIFEIIFAVDNGVSGGYYLNLAGSVLGLDKLYVDNPLKAFMPF